MVQYLRLATLEHLAESATPPLGWGKEGMGQREIGGLLLREVVCVTKGKGIIVTGGVSAKADLRPPRDIM